ncbi:nitrilase-related carbon-nitrogen hydrolase [Desulfotomaculum sp. 1211_IL3151]|uniref:nitrilase-related carbon-nitrogen hydrolase n=1 Tax=Desulfotomaculum sp. 1211_IL3151 TaxID=3084055 RepID=UPI002FDA1987
MNRNVTIGLIQMDCVLGDVPANVATASDKIRQAAAKGAQIVCLPELCTTGYRPELLENRLWELTEPVPGPTTDIFCRLAKELGIYIILPMNEKGASTGLIHNAAVFIDKGGQVQGVFRKVHAYATERYYFTDGNHYPVFETEFGKVGVMICYDMGFPEVARILTLQGAEVIFAPSAWRQEDEDIWDINIAARALENRLFVAAVNRVGREEDVVMHGKSKIVSTRGKTLAEAARFEEDILVATVDLAELIQGRRETPYLKDRKPAGYGLITQTY